MTTVAQLNQPRRPIAVGNRRLLSASRHCAPLRTVPQLSESQVNSTFPSLVGSSLSRLVVGNRHCAPRLYTTCRSTARPVVSHLISTNTKLSSDRIRAVIGGLVLLLRFATWRTTALFVVPPCTSSQRIPCQAEVAFGHLSVRRNHPAPYRDMARRCTLLRISPHLNGRPSGRHPQAFLLECFGMPSLVSTHATLCFAPKLCATSLISTRLTTT